MRETRRWRRLFAALALVTLLLVAGCGEDDDDEKPAKAAKEFPAGSAMAKLQDEGEITIGVKFDVPPFGFKNP